MIYLNLSTQPLLNLNSSWSDYILHNDMDHPTTPPHPRKLHAAGQVTLGDSTSLITTYRATVNVVTAKINPTLVYNDPPPG